MNDLHDLVARIEEEAKQTGSLWVAIPAARFEELKHLAADGWNGCRDCGHWSHDYGGYGRFECDWPTCLCGVRECVICGYRGRARYGLGWLEGGRVVPIVACGNCDDAHVPISFC